MILNKADLKTILTTNPTKKIWDEAAKDSGLLQMHILGLGIQSYLKRIEQHEGEKAFALRKKYGKSNRDMFARVLRPIDKIWSGRGGGVFYDTSVENDKRLRKMMLNVSKGYNVRDWIRNFWKPRYLDDPQGLIFMEVSDSNLNGCYPTYKASKEIFDALPNGRRLEYVVFKTADPAIFRVVDDLLDRLVKMEGEKVTELSGKAFPTYPNHFGTVPALIVSDIPKDGRDNYFMSPVWDEVELADQLLREGTIAGIHRFKHGFPKPWTYPAVCGTCKGLKTIGGKQCEGCNGTGVKLSTSAEDISVFAWPDKDNTEIRDKGGYVSPEIDYLKYADEMMELLEEKITVTHWGTYLQKSPDAKGEKETATGRFIDAQPVDNRLTGYAKAVETTETFITDMTGTYTFNTQFKGSAVNVGRRFQVEGPDVLWTKYETARKNGAPQSALDDMLQDYFETKFEGNELELQRSLKLAKLEPGVHLTIGECKSNLPYFDYMKKIYFQEFVSGLQPMAIISTDLLKLRADLETYTKTKIESAMPDPLAPIDENAPAAAKHGIKPKAGAPAA